MRSPGPSRSTSIAQDVPDSPSLRKLLGLPYEERDKPEEDAKAEPLSRWPFTAVDLGRWTFLIEVRKRYPQVLARLRDEVLPLLPEQRETAEPVEGRTPGRTPLEAWADSFGILSSPILAEAKMTLTTWDMSMLGRAALTLDSAHLHQKAGLRTGDPRQLRLCWHCESMLARDYKSRLGGRGTYLFEPKIRLLFNPDTESVQHAARRLRALLKEAKREFAASANTVAMHRMLVVFRQRGLAAKFRWLAAKQVGGLTYPQIASRFKVTQATATKGVQAAAEVLEIEVRRGKSGRPRGRRESLRRNSPTRG